LKKVKRFVNREERPEEKLFKSRRFVFRGEFGSTTEGGGGGGEGGGEERRRRRRRRRSNGSSPQVH
jgi:hypothetical protein